MVNVWITGARLRTLPAAIVPVAVGTAAAGTGEAGSGIVWWRAGAALVVSLALQVGTNYANDYSDGVRGTDDVRTGPVRLVGGGLASPRVVKRAAIASFLVAAAAGTALAVAVGPELFVIGALSIAAGWLYTGGPRPYGYYGLGELFVFVFFGLVATIGSAYIHQRQIVAVAVAASIPVGLLATALLVINNLRDIPTDRESGKRTLAVLLGDQPTRYLYVAMVVAVFPGVVATASFDRPWALLALGAIPLAMTPIQVVASGVSGARLISVLAGTGRLQLVTGLLLALGLALSA